jgi:hypothetical protein
MENCKSKTINLCPFCGARPLVDWEVIQPNGESGALHVTHDEECFFTKLLGTRTHAGGAVRQWRRRVREAVYDRSDT